MLQRLRQISISSSLRGAFLTGALLTLIVSSVSLYSWHEQSSQIRYSLDEYFPRIHAAFLIEGNLNLVVDQLNEFLLAPNRHQNPLIGKLSLKAVIAVVRL